MLISLHPASWAVGCPFSMGPWVGPRLLEGKMWGLRLSRRGPQSRQGYTVGPHRPRPAKQLRTAS